jgi:hypothetical protein
MTYIPRCALDREGQLHAEPFDNRSMRIFSHFGGLSPNQQQQSPHAFFACWLPQLDGQSENAFDRWIGFDARLRRRTQFELTDMPKACVST